MSLHPRDQWFSIYDRGPQVIVKDGRPTLSAPVFERTVGESSHAWHSDSYHPFGDVRRGYHETMARSGMAITACGKKFDQNRLLIETGRPTSERCKDCLAARAISDREIKEAERVAAELLVEQYRLAEKRLKDQL